MNKVENLFNILNKIIKNRAVNSCSFQTSYSVTRPQTQWISPPNSRLFLGLIPNYSSGNNSSEPTTLCTICRRTACGTLRLRVDGRARFSWLSSFEETHQQVFFQKANLPLGSFVSMYRFTLDLTTWSRIKGRSLEPQHFVKLILYGR
jgi:hypothetical protein